MTPRDLLSVARGYMAKGYIPIPVKYRRKQPAISAWTDFEPTDEALQQAFGNGPTNIGLLLGERSGDLVDVDLDDDVARRLTTRFLPLTGWTQGRSGAPGSHYFYIATGMKTERFVSVVDGGMLVEIRGTGCQTMVATSIHPNGEVVVTEKDGEPTQVDPDELRTAVAQLAAATLLVHHYPEGGSRHNLSNALSGWLIRGGWSEDQVAHFLTAVAEAAGDEELKGRLRNVGTTARRLADEKPATGARTVASILGEPVTRQLEQWLWPNSVISVNSVQGWEPLIEFDSSGVGGGPEFPLESLPPVVADYVAAVAKTVQVPIDMPAAIGLGIAAAAAAGRVKVQIGDTHSEPLNLYLAVVAASGERKDPVMRAMRDPLEVAERKLRREAREEEVSDEDPPTPLESPIPAPQLMVDDATPEALVRVMAEQGGRVAWISAEAGSLIDIVQGKYSKTGPNIDVFLKAYDGETIRVSRTTRPGDYVERPLLTIVVTPQPVLLERLASEKELRGRGLLARFAFVMPKSLVGTRIYRNKPISSDVKEAYEECIGAILGLPLPGQEQGGLTLRIDGDALDAWALHSDAIERAQAPGGQLESLGDWASKHASRVARIAGVIHLVEHAHQGDTLPLAIELETVERAWTIGHYLTDHALIAFSAMSLSPEVRLAQRVLDWIRRHQKNEFSIRDCQQHVREEPMALERAADLLAARGFVRRADQGPPRGPGRRPSPRYLVNPLTHAHNSQKSQKSTLGRRPRVTSA